jgi:hypothetical protein
METETTESREKTPMTDSAKTPKRKANSDGDPSKAAIENADMNQPADDDIFAKAERVRAERAKSGVKPHITRKSSPIPVVTKTKAWFQVHPDGVYTGIPVFIDPTSEDMERKPYYLTPDIADQLEGSDGLQFMTGYLICTAGMKNQLLLVKEADIDGNMHSATEAKHEACADAMTSWVRMTWDRDAGQYEVHLGQFERKTPRWPETIERVDIMRQAFGKALINDIDHLILKALRGEE